MADAIADAVCGLLGHQPTSHRIRGHGRPCRRCGTPDVTPTREQLAADLDDLRTTRTDNPDTDGGDGDG